MPETGGQEPAATDRQRLDALAARVTQMEKRLDDLTFALNQLAARVTSMAG